MAITVPIGLPMFFLAALLSGTLGVLADFSRQTILLLSSAGVVHFLWGRYCNYRATQALGTNLAAPVQQVNLIISLSLAIIVLGETLTPLRIFGIALVLLGPYYALRQQQKPVAETVTEAATSTPEMEIEDTDKPAPFEPKYPEGILFGLLSATGYGASPVLIRLALEDKGLAGELAGRARRLYRRNARAGAVSVVARAAAPCARCERESAKWFTISGVLVCLSQMFLFMAQSIAPVSVIGADQPIINPVPALFQPAAQSAPRGLRRQDHPWDDDLAARRPGAVGERGCGRRPPAGPWQPALHWHWP